MKQKSLLILLLFTTAHLYSHWFDIQDIHTIIQKFPSIQYRACIPSITTKTFNPWPIEPSYQTQRTFNELFILIIPKGTCQSLYGYTLVHGLFIKELIWGNQKNLLYNTCQNLEHIEPKKISGKVVVISQACCDSYSHFIHEVLGRLALLEMFHIQYDFLYIPNNKYFIKEFLTLWGIEKSTIISPETQTFKIQADELIVPSLVINTDVDFKDIGLYPHPTTMHYVREKLINKALEYQPTIQLSKRIFISRKDGSGRKIINEDDLFHKLNKYDFKRYELSKLSIIDQILLFHNAEIIIGEHGTGLTNILFCKPGTKVIELFQALKDASFWYLANNLELEYIPIKTIEYNDEYVTDWKSHPKEYMAAWKYSTTISIDFVIQKLKELQIIT